MTNPTSLDCWLAEMEARRKRCAEVLDVGGTEQALIGGDIDALLAMLRRAVEGLVAIQGPSLKSSMLRIIEEKGEIADQTLADLDRLAHEGEKR